jgi:benzoyl-CoA 2,3-dioxygenase component B
MTQPHKGFNRRIGEFAKHHISPSGELLSESAWNAGKAEWLPSEEDGRYINQLMKPCTEAGQYASWIAPPARGINNQAGDFEYVKIA